MQVSGGELASMLRLWVQPPAFPSPPKKGQMVFSDQQNLTEQNFDEVQLIHFCDSSITFPPQVL